MYWRNRTTMYEWIEMNNAYGTKYSFSAKIHKLGTIILQVVHHLNFGLQKKHINYFVAKNREANNLHKTQRQTNTVCVYVNSENICWKRYPKTLRFLRQRHRIPETGKNESHRLSFHSNPWICTVSMFINLSTSVNRS